MLLVALGESKLASHIHLHAFSANAAISSTCAM